jgi:hypothetical protein
MAVNFLARLAERGAAQRMGRLEAEGLCQFPHQLKSELFLFCRST